MPEDFDNASNDFAAPAESGVTETPPATSAGSEGAGVDAGAVPQSTGEASATPAADTSIDIGWSFDSGDEGQQQDAYSSIPENDDDIEQLSQDPALDQERLPGLVTALKTARSQFRELNGQLKQFQSQDQALAEYGGVNGVKAVIEPFAPLLRGEEGGAEKLLDALWNHAQPAYQRLADAIINLEPEYVIGKLQAAGKLPEASAVAAQAQTSSLLAPDVLASIPEHLHDTAKRLASEQPAVLEDLLLQNDDVRNYNLDREAKLMQLSDAEAAKERTAWEGSVKAAQLEGVQSVQNLSKQYEEAHFRELNKWKPYGSDEEANTEFRREVVEGAFAKILGDQKFAQMYTDVQKALEQAPMMRLRGETLRADQMERMARQQAMQFNTRLGQLMKARIDKHNALLGKARQYDDQQRQSVPRRTEISRNSNNVTGGGQKGTLDSNGRLSQQYLDDIANSIP